MGFSIEIGKCLISRLVSVAFFVAVLGSCTTQAVDDLAGLASQTPNINGEDGTAEKDDTWLPTWSKPRS